MLIGFPLVTSQLGSMTIRACKFSQWRGMHISPVVFYESPNWVPPKRPSSLLRLLNEISSARETDRRYEKLFVKKDSSPSTGQIFVDTAVYSRNQCFSLALSSKAGKSSALLPIWHFKCKDMVNIDLGRYSLASQELNFNSFISDGSVNYFSGKSPFPMLDKFIESVASIGTVSDLIRAVYYQKCHNLDCKDYSPMDAWWLQVIRVANTIENRQVMEYDHKTVVLQKSHVIQDETSGRESIPTAQRWQERHFMENSWFIRPRKLELEDFSFQKPLCSRSLPRGHFTQQSLV